MEGRLFASSFTQDNPAYPITLYQVGLNVKIFSCPDSNCDDNQMQSRSRCPFQPKIWKVLPCLVTYDNEELLLHVRTLMMIIFSSLINQCSLLPLGHCNSFITWTNYPSTGITINLPAIRLAQKSLFRVQTVKGAAKLYIKIRTHDKFFLFLYSGVHEVISYRKHEILYR